MKEAIIWKVKVIALFTASAGIAFLMFQPVRFMYEVLRLLKGEHYILFALWELFVPISTMAGIVLAAFALGLFVQEFLGFPVLRKTWKWLKNLDR